MNNNLQIIKVYPSGLPIPQGLYEDSIRIYKDKGRIHPASNRRLMNLELRYLAEKRDRILSLVQNTEFDPTVKDTLISAIKDPRFMAKIAKKSTEEAIDRQMNAIIKKIILIYRILKCNIPAADRDYLENIMMRTLPYKPPADFSLRAILNRLDEADREAILNNLDVETKGITEQIENIKWVSKYTFNFFPNISLYQKRLVKLIVNSNPNDAKLSMKLIKLFKSGEFVNKLVHSPQAAEILEKVQREIKESKMIDSQQIITDLEIMYRFARFGFSQQEYDSEPLTANRKRELQKYSEARPLSQVIGPAVLTFDTMKDHCMDTQAYLNHRFASEFVALLRSHSCEFFLGPQRDLVDFYSMQGYELAGELCNSTSTNLLFYNPFDPLKIMIVFLDINAQSMLNHVSLMLRYSGISLEGIKVRGEMKYQYENDLKNLEKALEAIFKHYQNCPKVAILGTNTKAMESLKTEAHHSTQATIGGLRLSYITVERGNKKIRVVAFTMPNGEISGHVVSVLLKHEIQFIVMAGGGGSLTTDSSIGSCQLMTQSTYNDQTVTLGKEQILPLGEVTDLRIIPNCHNVTVDSPLEETSQWLETNKQNNQCVDVETYHIMKALGGKPIKVIPAVFITDVLGTEYSLAQPIDRKNVNFKSFFDACMNNIEKNLKEGGK
jgi:hypothetical protein